jgi:hypothetical protein
MVSPRSGPRKGATPPYVSKLSARATYRKESVESAGPHALSLITPRGGGRESNPPGSFRPHTGFEDRGAHQAP